MRVRKLVAAAMGAVGTATACVAAVAPAQDDTDVQDRYADTIAGHTFVTIRRQVHYGAVLALTRLWDHRAGGSTGSHLRLDDISREFASTHVRYALVAWHVRRDTERMAGARPDAYPPEAIRRGAAESERVWAARIDQFPRVHGRLRDRRLRRPLANLHDLRSRRLAHSEVSPHPNKPAFEAPSMSDLRRVLRASQCLVRQAHLLVKRSHFSFADVERLRMESARAFWSMPLRAERRPGE